MFNFQSNLGCFSQNPNIFSDLRETISELQLLSLLNITEEYNCNNWVSQSAIKTIGKICSGHSSYFSCDCVETILFLGLSRTVSHGNLLFLFTLVEKCQYDQIIVMNACLAIGNICCGRESMNFNFNFNFNFPLLSFIIK